MYELNCNIFSSILGFRPHNTSGGSSVASHRQSMFSLWWTKWQWAGFLSQNFRFPLSVSFRKCIIVICSLVLLLPQGKGVKPGNLQTKQCPQTSEALDRKVLPYCLTSTMFVPADSKSCGPKESHQ